MKNKYAAVAGVIALLVLFAAFDFAYAKSGKMNQQSSLKNDPQTVMQIQQALSDKGYFQGTANGRWDATTQNALKKFQKSQDMNASGQLDPQTLASLGIQSGSAAGGQQDMSSSSQSGAGGQQETLPQQSDPMSGSPQGGSKY